MSDKNNIKIDAQNVNVFYADKQAINNVSLEVEKSKITALIGPSGCGKSTFLRCINRMNDVIPSCRVAVSYTHLRAHETREDLGCRGMV